MRRLLERPDELLFWAFALLLIWAPLPLGSNRPWAWTVLEVGLYALFAIWLMLWSLKWLEIPDACRRAWPALAVLSAWVAFQALEILPLPAQLVVWLSPESARLHQLAASHLGGHTGWITLSVDADASRTSLYKTLAYASAFILTLVLVNRRSRMLSFLRSLVYGALVYAVYAVLSHLAELRIEYFGMLLKHGDAASGTYANRNHFAGYLEMTLAMGVGLLIAGLSDRYADSWTKFVRHTIDWILSPMMVLRLALCVLVIALTTTHSRMGNTAFFASLLVAGLIGIGLSRHATRNTIILLASLVVIDLFIVGSWFGIEKLARRIEQTTIEDVQEREVPAVYSRDLIRDYPLFGSGPGTFYVAFPRYRQEKVGVFFQHAHNDYLQIASESGLVGIAALGIFVITCLGAALAAQWQRRDPLMRGAAFASIMGVTAILIHSWVDFNLQIPANATYFMVLLALGWIALGLGRSDSPAPRIGEA